MHIFISYRREDSEDIAARVAAELIARFGDDSVFVDSAIRGGEQWRERIDQELARCDVMLVVIGRNWAKVQGGDGRPRLEETDDVVAYETESALRRSVRLIPLLVQRAALPRPAELPERLRGLLKFNARELRTDAFERDFEVLLRDLAGKRMPRWRAALAGGALAAGVVAAIVGWWLGDAGTSSRQTALQRTFGEFTLRINLDPKLDPAILSPDRMWMSLIEPERLPKSELESTQKEASGVRVFSFRHIIPGENERFEADLVREVESSALAAPARTTICFTRIARDASPAPFAKLECNEGERCKVAAEATSQILACGERPASLLERPGKWAFLSSAYAQGAAEADAWIVPSLETLRRRHRGPDATPYVEVTLTSPPLPVLRQAKTVSIGIKVNGRAALIDGLPADANASPFDAGAGLNVQIGFENLDFSGAHAGFEEVGLTLRFLDGKKLVREERLSLRYVAFRSKPDPAPIGNPELGVRWSAKYIPGRANDRYQIVLLTSRTAEEVQGAKDRFDKARVDVATERGARPLVAVIRPPSSAGDDYSLAVGLREPTGQIRFDFDEGTSTIVCERIQRLARDQRFIDRNAYRRDSDNPRDSKRCAALARQ